MAKKQAAPTRDSFFQAALQSAKQRFGDNNAYVLAEHEKRVIGIPLDNLALMWLTDMTTWPLSRLTMTHGGEEAGKSAFLYWLVRQFVKHGGAGRIISTENKDSSSLMNSIIGKEMDWVFFNKATTVQEWQEHVTHAVINYIEQQGAHKTVPLIIGVDSLHGVQEASVKEDVDKQGFADPRGYPTAAASVTKYLQCRMGDLVGQPITLHCVNHVKQKIDAKAFGKTKRAAGAKHLRYQNTMDLWLDRMGTEADRRGFAVKITTEKNSLGASRRSIEAGLRWEPDKEHPGGQRTWWEWDKATIKLLVAFKDSKKSGEKGSAVFDVLEGFVARSGYYTCKRLGLTNVRAQELGAAINGDEKILNECVEALSIHQYNTFVAGMME